VDKLMQLNEIFKINVQVDETAIFSITSFW